jgi:pimeloyl-ACP methyl ester carboxylesterase
VVHQRKACHDRAIVENRRDRASAYRFFGRRADGRRAGHIVARLPYDAFANVAVILAEAGARVVRPYIRGFGLTRFRSAEIMRTGQQAARALDVMQLADALRLQRPDPRWI